MTWTKEREDEIRSRWAGHSSDVDAVFSWLDAEREARQRAEALLATIDKHTAHNDPMRVTASALARSIQRAERERDEARAAADEWERRETQALVDLGRAEAQRDEARAERDAIAARYDALREAAESYAEVAEVPAGHLDTIQDLARDTLAACLAYPDGAARERAERQAERERAIALEGYRVGHGNLASGRPELSDAEADEIIASVRGRT